MEGIYLSSDQYISSIAEIAKSMEKNLLEKLTVNQIGKKFLAFCRIRFISIVTSAHQRSLS